MAEQGDIVGAGDESDLPDQRAFARLERNSMSSEPIRTSTEPETVRAEPAPSLAHSCPVCGSKREAAESLTHPCRAILE